MNRRRMLSAAPAAMLLASTAAAGAAQIAEEAAPSFYSTLDPEQQAAFDKLRAIVKAQAAGTWVDPPNHDAELHTLCDEFQRLHAEGSDEDNPQWEQAEAEAWEIY